MYGDLIEDRLSVDGDRVDLPQCPLLVPGSPPVLSFQQFFDPLLLGQAAPRVRAPYAIVGVGATPQTSTAAPAEMSPAITPSARSLLVVRVSIPTSTVCRSCAMPAPTRRARSTRVWSNLRRIPEDPKSMIE